MSRCFPLPTIILLLSSVFIYGCTGRSGPELATVRGTVMQDNQPLQDGWISFQPEHGRMSYATILEDGRYELDYGVGRMGAIIGLHTVRIGQGGRRIDERTDSPRVTIYEQKSVDVFSGENTLNFNVPSKPEK